MTFCVCIKDALAICLYLSPAFPYRAQDWNAEEIKKSFTLWMDGAVIALDRQQSVF